MGTISWCLGHTPIGSRMSKFEFCLDAFFPRVQQCKKTLLWTCNLTFLPGIFRGFGELQVISGRTCGPSCTWHLRVMMPLCSFSVSDSFQVCVWSTAKWRTTVCSLNERLDWIALNQHTIRHRWLLMSFTFHLLPSVVKFQNLIDHSQISFWIFRTLKYLWCNFWGGRRWDSHKQLFFLPPPGTNRDNVVPHPFLLAAECSPAAGGHHW